MVKMLDHVLTVDVHSASTDGLSHTGGDRITPARGRDGTEHTKRLLPTTVSHDVRTQADTKWRMQ
jgi:hypothetical protein